MAQQNSPDVLPNLNIVECFCFPGNPWHQTNHQEVCWCKIWVSGQFTKQQTTYIVFYLFLHIYQFDKFWKFDFGTEQSQGCSLQINISEW